MLWFSANYTPLKKEAYCIIANHIFQIIEQQVLLLPLVYYIF